MHIPEDTHAIKSLTVTVFIPAVDIDGKGVRRIISQDEIEQAGREMGDEMHELNFPEVVTALVQSWLEEHFLKYHPIADVTDE